jgi:hypothetical protein
MISGPIRLDQIKRDLFSSESMSKVPAVSIEYDVIAR